LFLLSNIAKDFYTGKGWKISENPKKISFKNKNDVVSWYEQNTLFLKEIFFGFSEIFQPFPV
jgi:hypothetical protein